MCLGVPGQVIERDASELEFPSGVVEFAGVRRRVSLVCTREAAIGDYVIVHAGIAISRIDPAEAERVLACLRGIPDDDGWVPEGGPDALRR